MKDPDKCGICFALLIWESQLTLFARMWVIVAHGNTQAFQALADLRRPANSKKQLCLIETLSFSDPFPEPRLQELCTIKYGKCFWLHTSWVVVYQKVLYTLVCKYTQIPEHKYKGDILIIQIFSAKQITFLGSLLKWLWPTDWELLFYTLAFSSFLVILSLLGQCISQYSQYHKQFLHIQYYRLLRGKMTELTDLLCHLLGLLRERDMSGKIEFTNEKLYNIGK